MSDKKKNTKAAKKSEMKELSQTHGMVDQGNFTHSTLNQIWGDNGLGKYKTLNEGEYKSYLDNLSKMDVRNHASSLGLLPIDNLELLKGRLIREFQKHVNSYRKPVSNTVLSELPISEEASRILKEGR